MNPEEKLEIHPYVRAHSEGRKLAIDIIGCA